MVFECFASRAVDVDWMVRAAVVLVRGSGYAPGWTVTIRKDEKVFKRPKIPMKLFTTWWVFLFADIYFYILAKVPKMVEIAVSFMDRLKSWPGSQMEWQCGNGSGSGWTRSSDTSWPRCIRLPRAFESVAAKNVQKGIFKTQFLNAYLCCFNFSAWCPLLSLFLTNRLPE